MQYLMNENIVTLFLLAVVILCAAGLFLIGNWIQRKGPVSQQQKRITNFVVAAPDDSQVSQASGPWLVTNVDVGKFRNWLNESLSNLSSEKLQLKLSSVYWAITDTEFIFISILATILVFLMGWLIAGSFLAGLFLAILAILAPRVILDMAIIQRQKKFHNQLLDVLVLIKGAVQAGYGLMQALDLAIKEIPAPASEEFGRVLREIQLGITLQAALTNLAQRMENDDLQIVVTAIIINSQVGGNLSTVLEASISTIRDRIHLMGEIRSLTSYARYVGYLLTLLPFITGALVFVVSPSYFDTVKTSLITQVIFGMAFLGIIIGNIWIRKIIKIKV
jgi:tight adherence protein B